ncbi:DUF3570 domain-containing protein [Candidatus Poribacteria bacterium]|nr:DUF3570 domain-containing protein [Candidatus Poribacteria bacterium]
MSQAQRKKVVKGFVGLISYLAICVIGLVLTMKQAARSEDAISVKASVFEDNRNVLIYLNDEHLQKGLGRKGSVAIHHEVDAVSSASIGCTVCHPNGQVTARNEFNVEGEYFFNRDTNTAISLKYYTSGEMDYRSNSVSASFVRDFFNRNMTLSATYGYTSDSPRPHGWRQFTAKYTTNGTQIISRINGQPTGRFQFQPEVFNQPLVVDGESKRTQNLGFSLTQVLSPKTIAQANVDLAFVNGYQSNPYHIVRVNDKDFIESHPEQRTRRAFAGQVNHALNRNTFLQGSYRYYNDTWGIRSHTLQADIGRYLCDKTWLLDLGFRRYLQSKADFYQEVYIVPQEFMTDDYRLAAFNANSYRAKVVYTPQFFRIHPFLKNLGVDATYQHYTATSGFSSNLWQLGVQSQF